jgi:hypothetical protein
MGGRVITRAVCYLNVTDAVDHRISRGVKRVKRAWRLYDGVHEIGWLGVEEWAGGGGRSFMFRSSLPWRLVTLAGVIEKGCKTWPQVKGVLELALRRPFSLAEEGDDVGGGSA